MISRLKSIFVFQNIYATKCKDFFSKLGSRSYHSFSVKTGFFKICFGASYAH
nr:MAG TPA: hypothetical protein [Caudoviricetes sp.]